MSLFPFEDFLVPISPNSKGKILRGIIDRLSLGSEEDSVQILDLYLSEVAFGVHFEILDAGGLRRTNSMKQLIGRSIRLLSHEAQMLGVSVPIIGFISTKKQDGQTQVDFDTRKWEGDQDWHRGDFILVHLKDGEEQEQIANFLQGFGEFTNRTDVTIEPIDEQVFLQRLQNQPRSEEYEELFQALEDAVKTQSTEFIDDWLNACLSEAVRQTQEGGVDPNGEGRDD